MLQYSVALFPQMSPDISKKQPHCFHAKQGYLILQFSVARCIVSIIMANTSLVSETLLTKRAILSESDAYTCTCI